MGSQDAQRPNALGKCRVVPWIVEVRSQIVTKAMLLSASPRPQALNPENSLAKASPREPQSSPAPAPTTSPIPGHSILETLHSPLNRSRHCARHDCPPSFCLIDVSGCDIIPPPCCAQELPGARFALSMPEHPLLKSYSRLSASKSPCRSGRQRGDPSHWPRQRL